MGESQRDRSAGGLRSTWSPPDSPRDPAKPVGDNEPVGLAGVLASGTLSRPERIGENRPSISSDRRLMPFFVRDFRLGLRESYGFRAVHERRLFCHFRSISTAEYYPLTLP